MMWTLDRCWSPSGWIPGSSNGCGEEFAIGSSVSWTLVDRDLDWLEPVVGADELTRIRFAEDHHALADSRPKTAAVVRSIRAVLCRYLRSGLSIPGSAVSRGVQRATGWEDETDGRHFVGYLVELDIPAHGGDEGT
jgi:hypothetical protein